MGVRADIAQALANRLMTITNANGYTTNVVNVFYDKIPMGLQLEAHEIPAILLIAGNDTLQRNSQCVYGQWQFFMQMICGDVPDSTMFQFTRDVFKAIYAGSPTDTRLDAFRLLNDAVYDVEPVVLEPDLNTIEANRFGLLEINVKYVTRLYNL